LIDQDKTRIKKTEDSYIKRAINLTSKFENMTGEIFHEKQDAFVLWLITDTTGKSFSNLRQIKAALTFYSISINQNALAIKIANIPSTHTSVKSIGNATSSQKKKSVSAFEEQKITEFLRMKLNSSTDSGLNKQALSFFKAGLFAGLRPCEWETAYLIESETSEAQLSPPILKVKNAKSTNGRSFGEFRYIGLNALTPQQLLWVKMALSYASNPVTAKGESTTFDTMYESMRKRIYIANKALFPSKKLSVTLYSCRHQLIANLKKNGYSLPEIAAIVGHGNDITASEHYGKKVIGIKGGTLPLANPWDVAKIKKIYVGRNREDSNNPVKVK